jgi:hypothetical protein
VRRAERLLKKSLSLKTDKKEWLPMFDNINSHAYYISGLVDYN